MKLSFDGVIMSSITAYDLSIYPSKNCRKLNLDCVAAVVGFDAHGGFSHAVMDGNKNYYY